MLPLGGALRGVGLASVATLLMGAAASRAWAGTEPCGEMEYLDPARAMCMPLPMVGMPMRMLMLHGNAFGAFVSGQGTRGRDGWVAPSMLMADLGTSVGDRHYLSVELMATTELWTYPGRGYPELLQIGETDQQGAPFVDAQHPHSTPIMGLTFSDTFALGGGKDHLRLFAAPRGEATEGPVAFMHRSTGMVNPDAPLGHHIGQDVSHIASTVLGASLGLGDSVVEASVFHGAEPDPERIDLPLGAPDSFGVRLIRAFSPGVTAMASVAYVNRPEPDQPEIGYENRYSASVYFNHALSEEWVLRDALIAGLVQNYDHAPTLLSFGEEFLLEGSAHRLWGRVELVQRTPAELRITDAADPDRGVFVAALTLGYTHRLAGIQDDLELGAGGSITKDLLPAGIIGAYGGDPWSGKVFLQLGGMKMVGL